MRRRKKRIRMENKERKQEEREGEEIGRLRGCE